MLNYKLSTNNDILTDFITKNQHVHIVDIFPELLHFSFFDEVCIKSNTTFGQLLSCEDGFGISSDERLIIPFRVSNDGYWKYYNVKDRKYNYITYYHVLSILTYNKNDLI